MNFMLSVFYLSIKFKKSFILHYRLIHYAFIHSLLINVSFKIYCMYQMPIIKWFSYLTTYTVFV